MTTHTTQDQPQPFSQPAFVAGEFVLLDGKLVMVRARTIEIASRTGFVLMGDTKSCRLMVPPGWPTHEPRTISESSNIVGGMPGMEAYLRRLAGVLGVLLPEREEGEDDIGEGSSEEWQGMASEGPSDDGIVGSRVAGSRVFGNPNEGAIVGHHASMAIASGLLCGGGSGGGGGGGAHQQG